MGGDKIGIFWIGKSGGEISGKILGKSGMIFCFCFVKGSDFVRIFCKFSLQTILIFFYVFTNGILSINEYLFILTVYFPLVFKYHPKLILKNNDFAPLFSLFRICVLDKVGC